MHSRFREAPSRRTVIPVNGNADTPEPPESGTADRPRYLYSVPDFAYLCGGITERYVYSLIDGGKLRSVKLGRRRFIPHDAAKEFLAGLNVPVNDQPGVHSPAA